MEFYEGYHKALTDLASWINAPNSPLDSKLCKPKHLEKVIAHIIENLDEFMPAPTSFCFDFEITKGKLKIQERA